MASFLDNPWCGLTWTEFYHFDAQATFRGIQRRPGLYRVRIKGLNQLAYVGQTDRCLRQRLSGLRIHTLATEMPFNDPHTAACRLWSYRVAENYEYECSAAPLEIPRQERMALECYLIWQYRQEVGQSTLCNFGRMHPLYTPSRNRSTGKRGARLLDDQRYNEPASSIPPLQAHGDPSARDWMNLAWEPLNALRSNSLNFIPITAGLYKLIDDLGQLLYLGQSVNLRSRLSSHQKKRWNGRDVFYSIWSRPELIIARHRLEIENDLIGGHYSVTKSAPLFQFENCD